MGTGSRQTGAFFVNASTPDFFERARGANYNFSAMDYRFRRKKLRDQLHANTEALLVTHLPNIRYLSGFTGSAGVLVVAGKNSILFTDGRYRQQAKDEASTSKVVIANSSALVAAAKWITDRKLHVIGIETEHMTVSMRSALRRMLPVGTRLRETRSEVESIRMVKDEEELQCIREAARLGSSLIDTALQAIRPGVTEIEVAAEMEYDARQKGAEAMSFDTIVASGERSALPHGRASAARISRGFVVLDFGVILAGYCSDKTRTVYVGKPSARDRQMYEAVREAQQAAIDTVRAGIAAGEVDSAARSVLRRAKLDKHFTHSTGHGVGLDIHEPPRIGSNQMELLRAGMVITIEPGVYVAGEGGVRIEDMVIVTEQGCEVLWPATKDLITL
jgi:Xaa-Pro aminopeptidase